MKRLTPAFLTMIMFGVVGLLVLAYVTNKLLAAPEKKAVATTRNVPMAVGDIEPGTLITANHLGQGPHPLDKLDRDMLLADRVIVGRYAKVKIKAAQPIRASALYQPNELPPLEVTAGMRAVTVEVGDSTGMVDGLIKPTNYVDVLFTVGGNAGGGGGDEDRLQGGTTLRLFEGVRVLAINRSQTQSRIETRGNNRVTLELTEPQANIITLAAQRGSLTLTYNPAGAGNGGLSLNDQERVTLNEILGLKAIPKEPEPFVSEIYKGSGRNLNYFNDKGRKLENYQLPNPNSRPQYRVPGGSLDRGALTPGAAPVPSTPIGDVSPTAARPTLGIN